jgi:hypothetical protein
VGILASINEIKKQKSRKPDIKAVLGPNAEPVIAPPSLLAMEPTKPTQSSPLLGCHCGCFPCHRHLRSNPNQIWCCKLWIRERERIWPWRSNKRMSERDYGLTYARRIEKAAWKAETQSDHYICTHLAPLLRMSVYIKMERIAPGWPPRLYEPLLRRRRRDAGPTSTVTRGNSSGEDGDARGEEDGLRSTPEMSREDELRSLMPHPREMHLTKKTKWAELATTMGVMTDGVLAREECEAAVVRRRACRDLWPVWIGSGCVIIGLGSIFCRWRFYEVCLSKLI